MLTSNNFCVLTALAPPREYQHVHLTASWQNKKRPNRYLLQRDNLCAFQQVQSTWSHFFLWRYDFCMNACILSPGGIQFSTSFLDFFLSITLSTVMNELNKKGMDHPPPHHHPIHRLHRLFPLIRPWIQKIQLPSWGFLFFFSSAACFARTAISFASTIMIAPFAVFGLGIPMHALPRTQYNV